LRPIRAVLFDFAETLLFPEETPEMIRAGLSALGNTQAVDAEIERLATEIESAFASEDYVSTRERRDLSAADHRAVFTAAFAAAEGMLEGLADAMYDRLTDPRSWKPYTDTQPALAALRREGIRLGVVSNIGFDIRPIFSHHRLAELVETFALSFENGVVKPDPRLFEVAMRDLQAQPAETLMVGDDVADAGAVRAGARVYLLPPVVTSERRGLGEVLRLTEATGS
jgi:HAD superfamily hydrolase (TIGR01493 family)